MKKMGGEDSKIGVSMSAVSEGSEKTPALCIERRVNFHFYRGITSDLQNRRRKVNFEMELLKVTKVSSAT